ncbi:MAG: MarR family transcriptional regulator [Methanobrevibacter sp.]|uniref:MarR family winged helix-turn-helix transcriptional regulator n=1 Tax=Methanobrevibacter sp. TaxID=66852 RepID=UPI001B0199CA|nr:MarR family transcriptional regulator [Methanobrevibacter sp.]MBO7443413.1 MarR family transcriptional regulator [Methanobrevibacter sp.]MBO7734102.1 MarR family transcriptional regulator [Methanobrevibacter sp.]MBP5700644.1 MarR family transcriptional regulator [Methanobrevibacter sp.]MBP5784383.1 MarR family transcriptional regulator [Methanobrevibacter sp.]
MKINENPENMFLYHYVEELISDYGSYYDVNLENPDLTIKEYSVLLRIRFTGRSTQHDLVELFKVSGAYMAKLLKKFEDEEYIIRIENPENRRKKIVELTEKGVEKTDKLIKVIDEWEKEVTSDLTEDEKIILKKLLSKIVWR